MKARTLRLLSLTILLAGLCCPTGAQAQAPVASNNALTTVAGAQQYIYLCNNTTWSGGSIYNLTYSIVKPSTNGVITFPGAPSYTYYCTYTCTNLSYIGPDSFVWRAANGGQTSQLATCSISVVAPVAPTATAFSVTATPGAGIQDYYFGAYVTIPSVDSGAQATYSFVTLPTNGTVIFPYGATSSFLSYTPNNGFAGTDSFLWNVGVGAMTSTPAQCTVIVPANIVPTALACTNTAPSGAPVTNTMLYTDPDSGQTHTAIVKSQPAHGSASVDAGGGVLVDYCSAPGFVGTDTFNFAISDGVSTSAPAVCTMIVTAAPPVALAQTVVAMKNTPITIPLSCKGGGGYTCWPVRVTSPSPGTLTTNGYAFIYTPSTNATGNDSFTWQMAYKTNGGAVLLSPSVKCSIVIKDTGGNTDWTQWRFDECRTAQSPAVLPNQLYLQWQRALPALSNKFNRVSSSTHDCDIENCRPVQLGKQLFVSLQANDSVSAYNTDTGALNWRYYTSGALRRPPLALALTNGTNVVIFGCDDGYLYCLNAADGSECWKFRAAPLEKKAMGFGRLSSVWPIWSSPVAYSNRIYVVAGYLPTWQLFGYCLDAASGNVVWKNDGAMLGDGRNSSLGPLAFSTDHVMLYGTRDAMAGGGWMLNANNGVCSLPLSVNGTYGFSMGTSGFSKASPDIRLKWFVDGSGASATSEPMSITAGGQTFTAASVLGLGVQGTVGSLLAGDGKLFVSTRNGNLYCFGTNVVQTNSYPCTVTPLPTTNDIWTAVVQNILTGRPDLGQGLALVWGVGSGRLVTELAQQAPGLMIVAADPDFNKLQALRAKMDAAGWSGARVSTVQGNPMNCGFAPYQAALIVSEDLNAAGWTNGPAMAKALYKATRPFGGQIWLPTNDVADVTAWLNAANLPTCSNGPSYQVTARSVSGRGLTCIERTGLPDANLAIKPPFRLIAFDVFQGATLNPNNNVNPVKGTKDGYDLYSWLPMTASESGYEPVVAIYNTQQACGSKNTGGLPIPPTTNRLFSLLEAKPLIMPAGEIYGNCNGWDQFNSTYIDAGKIGYMFDVSNYWGLLAMPEMGGNCLSGNTIVGNGEFFYLPFQACSCFQGFTVPQIGVVSCDESNEEQWVQYYAARSSRPVQETPIRAIGVNFGAICDRWDDVDQLVWTHHPMHPPYLQNLNQAEPFPLVPVTYRGNVTNQYHYSGAMTTTSSNSHGWVAASYVAGMTGMTLPLAQPLVAARGTPTLPLTGYLNDACWTNSPQITLKTTSCDTNGHRSYAMLCYDATNLYVGGVLHQPGARPSDSSGTCPVYMKVALGGRDRSQPPMQTIQLDVGEATSTLPGTNCVGLASNAWSWAFATNVEMFTGVICIPWTNLTAAGVWPSQLVMNVEICGDLLNGSHRRWYTSDNGLLTYINGVLVGVTTELPNYLSPVFFDVARGPMAENIPHTVRLYFAEMEGLTNGQRVFDVKLQGQTVLTNLDVFAAAGGRGSCEVMKEFASIGIADKLNLDFVAKAGQPILGGVEIMATADNAANQPPVAIIDASTLAGPAPLDVQFSAQRSYDPDGQITECAWDTGDGRVARGSLLRHVFTEPGTYQVCLLVTDNRGATSATNVPITVTAGVPAAFVINIRSNKAPNCDYTSFEAWSSGYMSPVLPCDLTSSSMMFQVSSAGNYVAADNLTGVTFTGGKTGVLRYVANWVTNGVTSTYVAIANVGGTGTVMTGTIRAKSGHIVTNLDTGVATTSLLFTVSATNTYVAADDGQVVIFNGGGMGVLRHINHATPPLALISECRGLILTGAVTCAAGHAFAVSDTGYPVYNVIANCFNDWTNGLHFNMAVTLSGTWLTDPNHCVVVRAAPGQGHTGKIRGTNGYYSGFTLTVPFSVNTAPYTRINQIIVDTNTLTVGSGCSVNHVLGSVVIIGPNGVAANAVTIANSIAPVFNAGISQDISFHNCTGGSFLMSDINASRIRAVNCLAYSNSAGFTTTPTNEVWLNHCVSLDGSANLADAWKDGNIGNLANQTVTFVNAGNDFHLAANDTGAIGKGQPGLGADINGNLRAGPLYDVGAHQTTNTLTLFQQWQLQYFGSLTALNAASNVVNSAGISNYQMFLAGSNPADSNTWFRFTALAPVTGSKWGMNFNTVSGKSYTVAWKTNLLDGLSWRFYTNFSGLGGSAQVIFTNSLPQAFFQIQAQ